MFIPVVNVAAAVVVGSAAGTSVGTSIAVAFDDSGRYRHFALRFKIKKTSGDIYYLYAHLVNDKGI